MPKPTPAAAAADDFDPTKVNAYTYLHLHCTQKAVQVGAVATVPVVAGAALISALRGKPLGRAQATQLGSATFVAVSGLLTVATAYKVYSLDLEGVQERVYRLHYNEGQAHADRLANAGAAIGAGVALAVASPTPANVLSGFVAGTLAGLAAHVAGVKRKSRAASAQ